MGTDLNTTEFTSDLFNLEQEVFKHTGVVLVFRANFDIRCRPYRPTAFNPTHSARSFIETRIIPLLPTAMQTSIEIAVINVREGGRKATARERINEVSTKAFQ